MGRPFVMTQVVRFGATVIKSLLTLRLPPSIKEPHTRAENPLGRQGRPWI